MRLSSCNISQWLGKHEGQTPAPRMDETLQRLGKIVPPTGAGCCPPRCIDSTGTGHWLRLNSWVSLGFPWGSLKEHNTKPLHDDFSEFHKTQTTPHPLQDDVSKHNKTGPTTNFPSKFSNKPGTTTNFPSICSNKPRGTTNFPSIFSPGSLFHPRLRLIRLGSTQKTEAPGGGP